MYNEERYIRGIVYFTVLCDHPYLVSLLFAPYILLHFHFITFMSFFFSSRHMFELKFANTEVVKKQWVVALLG